MMRWNLAERMSRFRSPPELSKFESPGFKSLQMLSNGQHKIRIKEELQAVDSNMVQLKSDCEIASQSSENDNDMSNTSDSDAEFETVMLEFLSSAREMFKKSFLESWSTCV
ncbi:hypothetical protein Q3G72_007857 [Acer saccharum]|nr:hypothetical protein Q3G72_007857 [Acer saccharum]